MARCARNRWPTAKRRTRVSLVRIEKAEHGARLPSVSSTPARFVKRQVARTPQAESSPPGVCSTRNGIVSGVPMPQRQSGCKPLPSPTLRHGHNRTVGRADSADRVGDAGALLALVLVDQALLVTWKTGQAACRCEPPRNRCLAPTSPIGRRPARLCAAQTSLLAANRSSCWLMPRNPDNGTEGYALPREIHDHRPGRSAKRKRFAADELVGSDRRADVLLNVSTNSHGAAKVIHVRPAAGLYIESVIRAQARRACRSSPFASQTAGRRRKCPHARP